MGSARDSAPDPRRADNPVCPPLSARAPLHPVSAIAPIRHSSSGPSRPQPPAIAKPATCHTLRHYAGSRTMPGAVTALPSMACSRVARPA